MISAVAAFCSIHHIFFKAIYCKYAAYPEIFVVVNKVTVDLAEKWLKYTDQYPFLKKAFKVYFVTEDDSSLRTADKWSEEIINNSL